MQVLANIAKRLQTMHEAGYAHRDLKPANVMWLPRENQWTLIDFGCAAAIGEEGPLSFTLAYAAPEVIAVWQSGVKKCMSTGAVDAWALGVMVYEMLTGRTAFDVFMQGRDAVRTSLLHLSRATMCHNFFIQRVALISLLASDILCNVFEGRAHGPTIQRLGNLIHEYLVPKPQTVLLQVVAQLLGNQPLPWENMSQADRRKLGAFRGPILQLLSRDPSQRPTMPEFYHACNSIFSTSTTYTSGGTNTAMASGNTGKVAEPPVESPALPDTVDVTRTMNGPGP
ncbi:MAG: protein kinase [Akkermansiaceae bacterium]|nr:protein kinase [Akkermansiaceae bacterium]